MSASLVGSEMCIRDSILRQHSLAATPRSGRSRLKKRARAAKARHSPATVSYTHLTLPTICSV
eukprot:7333537-Alexandrium_andersonii.AAC.1